MIILLVFTVPGLARQKAEISPQSRSCLGCHKTATPAIVTDWQNSRMSQTTPARAMKKDKLQRRISADRIPENLEKAWQTGAAHGPQSGASPFDEPIERLWTETWMFYVNSVRFASAMSGADYGVFAQGRCYLTRSIHKMAEMAESGRQGP